MVDVLMNDIGLSGSVLIIVGGAQVVRSPFGIWQLDGILAAMGVFRETGGTSFREMIRRTLRLWANGGWITTCFVDTDWNEIAVALLSNRPTTLDENASLPKKGGGLDEAGDMFWPSVANIGSTDKLCCCCSILLGESCWNCNGVTGLLLWIMVSEDSSAR
jgi:hypothetical protein